MDKDVFSYRDYKRFLREALEALPKRGRGARTALAAAMGCQLAYLSQVLNGDAQLNLEQAEAAARSLNLIEDETRFFLLLVQRARAGTPALRRYLDREISQLAEKRLSLTHRFGARIELAHEHQVTYYSAWYYAAVHILLTIPVFRTRDAIATALGLSLQRVSEVLDFLVSVGLARNTNGTFETGEARSYLPSDSPLISKHHTNWRMHAIQSLDRGGGARGIADGEPADLHYSSLISFSREDRARVQEILVRAIEEIKKVVADSPAEEARCFSLDFFRL